MNSKEQIESVFGVGDGAAANSADDKDARIAELEKELQRERVEFGRLKKTKDELEALREENARLKAKNGVDEAIASVPDDIREDVAPEVLRASGAMAASVSERVSRDFERTNEEIRMLREENSRRDRSMFMQRINMRYPGFVNAVSAGGDKHDAWKNYQRFNARTIMDALNGNDFDTMSYHIDMFYREIGVPVPSGAQDESTIPEPRSNGGGNPADSGDSANKHYTVEEFDALERKANDARARGDIDAYRRMTQEMDNILSEGRIG